VKLKYKNPSSIIPKILVFVFITSLLLNNFLWGEIKSLNHQQVSILKNEMNSYYSALYALEITISQNQIDPNEFRIHKTVLIESSNRLSYFITSFLEVNGNIVLNDFTLSLVDNLEKILLNEELPEANRDKLLKEQRVLINTSKETFNIEETQKMNKEDIELRIEKFLLTFTPK